VTAVPKVQQRFVGTQAGRFGSHTSVRRSVGGPEGVILVPKDQVVVVSDLHVDTWNRRTANGRSKQEAFPQFLSEIRPRTRKLYITGDLFDLPPREYDQAGIMARFGGTLSSLLEFSSSSKVFWLVGNHDVGACGAQLVLGSITVWYPHIAIRPPGKPRKRIILEHGHFYDPVIALYAKNLAMASYYGEARDQPVQREAELMSSMLQRRNRDGRPAYDPGVMTMERRRTGWEWVRRRCRDIVEEYYTVDHWRKHAALAMRHHDNLTGRRHQVCIMGHTHCPDFYRAVYKEAENSSPRVAYWYYNAGSWAESEPCMPYLVVKDDGTIQRRCFHLPDVDDLSIDECGPQACLYVSGR